MRGAGGPQAVTARRAQRKRKYLQSSKATKNFTLAVSRLPDDVLVDIFFRCGPHPIDLLRSWNARHGIRADENISCFLYEKPWMAYGNLIRFSHVCQRWRRIIRMTGAFWSYRTVCARSNMPSFLVHSLVRDASLVIDLVLASGETSLGLQPWVRDKATIAQTGTLQAIISPSRWRHFSDLVKASPAPALKTLTVANTRNGPYNDQDVGLGSVGDSVLFADTAPLLRKVYLISVRVPSDSTILRNLTVLCLCNANVVGDYKRVEGAKTGHILDIISRCPNLESLVLDRTLPYATQDTTSSKRIVLSSLKHISILGTYQRYYDDGQAGRLFLSHLDLPSLSNLHLGHSPPVAMSLEELVPKGMQISVGDANALSIKLYENNASRDIENVEIKFGIVSEKCLTSDNEFPSLHFSTLSTVTYTVDHHNHGGHSDMAAIAHSFIQHCLGSRRNSVNALILQLETRLNGRYRKHNSLHLQKLFDFLPELVVVEVRCKCNSSMPFHSEYREGFHGSKTPAVISDIEADAGTCNGEITVWPLGLEVAAALHDSVLRADSKNAGTGEKDGIADVNHDLGKEKGGSVVLPRLARLSFVGAYFNTAADSAELNTKKSWHPGPAFEHLMTYVDHRAQHAVGVEDTGDTSNSEVSVLSSSSAFTFTLPTSPSCSTTSEELEISLNPQAKRGSIPSLRFTDCYGIRDDFYEKLSIRCGAKLLSPHALHKTRSLANALEWDMRDPWFVPNAAPKDDDEDKRRKLNVVLPEEIPLPADDENLEEVQVEADGGALDAENNTVDPLVLAPTETVATVVPDDGVPRQAVIMNDEQDVSYGIHALNLATTA